MAQYNVEHSCGHTKKIALYGPTKTREWRIEREQENVCSDCYEKQLAEQAAAAAKENSDCGLPALLGTEKQVSWAEQIRNDAMRFFEGFEVTPRTSFRLRDAPQDKIDQAVQEVMAREKASWWIDNRGHFNREVVVEFLEKEIAATHKQVAVPKAVVAEVNVEDTVRPEKPKTATVAEIRIKGDLLEVDFPEKREDFWGIIKKQLGFIWSGKCWERTITVRSGPVSDRAAEVGHRLLGAGFAVRIYDGAVREMAISGQYSAEQTRWVVCRKAGVECAGWFVITWDKDDDLYAAAKRIPGSRYLKPFVAVPPEQYEQVLDFATHHKFTLSDAAQQAADQARQVKEDSLVVSVSERKRSPHIGDKPEKLAVPEEVGIDESLRDQD